MCVYPIWISIAVCIKRVSSAKARIISRILLRVVDAHEEFPPPAHVIAPLAAFMSEYEGFSSGIYISVF